MVGVAVGIVLDDRGQRVWMHAKELRRRVLHGSQLRRIHQNQRYGMGKGRAYGRYLLDLLDCDPWELAGEGVDQPLRNRSGRCDEKDHPTRFGMRIGFVLPVQPPVMMFGSVLDHILHPRSFFDQPGLLARGVPIRWRASAKVAAHIRHSLGRTTPCVVFRCHVPHSSTGPACILAHHKQALGRTSPGTIFLGVSGRDGTIRLRPGGRLARRMDRRRYLPHPNGLDQADRHHPFDVFAVTHLPLRPLFGINPAGWPRGPDGNRHGQACAAASEAAE